MQQDSNHTKRPKIGIVYLSFHCEPYIDDVVSALKKITYPKDCIEFIIVDNPHPTHGHSIRYLEEHVMPLSGKELPRVTLMPQKENLGFGPGNNVGTEKAKEFGCDYVFYHNNDGFVAANAFEPLIDYMESHPSVGAAQSLMLLHPETELVNSTGNIFQYLGFGYGGDYRAKISDLTLPPNQEIHYASGAALMVRMSLIDTYGAWDDHFFMYHEDLEWSLRLRIAGYKIVLIRDSVFYHKYQFSRSIKKFYWMERNRYGVMLMFFRWRTLLLLLPMALVLEAGLWLFALRGGWLAERIKVYQYWINPRHWVLWLKKRKKIQKMRAVSDRYLLTYARGGIYFQEKAMENPILEKIGNPMMNGYFTLIKMLVKW